MYGEHGIYAYTPEVGADSDGFWPSTMRIVPLAEENLFPNQFAAWAVGAKYDVNFSIEDGPYEPGSSYSTDLAIFNSGLANSHGQLTLSINSPQNYLSFETPLVDMEGIEARTGIELGDMFTFQVSASAPSGVMAELNIQVSEEGVLLYEKSFDIVIGVAIPIAIFNFAASDGWTVGAIDDDATAGIWESAVPVATYFDGNQAQPGTDQSEEGEKCFLTGAATSGGSVGFDDVDGGKTTLLSPVFDLSEYNEVLVSYWRWYTNNVGDNPGTDHWQVDVTSDGGQN
jgi:hypothetical protein